MSDQVMDLRSATSVLRRHRRVLAAAALAGLLAGVGYVATVAPALSSTTLVLLPTPSVDQGSSSRDVDTQVRIALSTTVLGRAGQALKPPFSARRVEQQVEVSAPTEQLLEIKASSTSAGQARVLSQAVADAYLGYVKDTARAATTAAIADLRRRQGGLESQIGDLQKEVVAAQQRQRVLDPESPEGTREAQLLAGLRTEQADLSLQSDKLKDQIASAEPLGSLALQDTTIIQQASPASGRSTVQRLLGWLPVSTLAAVLLAAAVLLLTFRRDPKLGLRDEIADAVGSPVLAAVRSRPQRSVAGWATLFGSYEATPVESWAFRQVLRALVPVEARASERRTDPRSGRLDHPRSVAVVCLAGDGRALALGPQLAAFAAAMGVRTRLVTAAGGEHAAALWAACAADRAGAAESGLLLGEGSDDESAELTVVIAVLDRRAPDLANTPTTEKTLLAVATAAATEQELARVAVAVDDAGRQVDGIVVADPDRADRTSGRHTMDERSRQVPLPVRLTGVTPVEQASADPRRGRR